MALEIRTPSIDPAQRFTRLKDWEQRLADFVERARRTPFIFGENDCGLMGANAVLAITGTDPAEDLRGQYKTATDGMRLMAAAVDMESYDGPDYAAYPDFLSARLGEPVHPARARKGDLVLGIFGDPGQQAYSLMVDLGKDYLLAAKDGAITERKDLVTATSAWRIG
jgi:hypothetical protein